MSNVSPLFCSSISSFLFLILLIVSKNSLFSTSSYSTLSPNSLFSSCSLLNSFSYVILIMASSSCKMSSQCLALFERYRMIYLQIDQVSSQICSVILPSSLHLLPMILISSFMPTPMIIFLYSIVSSAVVGGVFSRSFSHSSSSLTAERCPS